MAETSIPALAGTELAILSRTAVTPADARKPYQLEARLNAARSVSDPETKLSLWREALALSPTNSRARAGALLAAIALRRDALALALEQPPPRPYGMPAAEPVIQSAAEQASIAEALAAAAERLDDLDAALRQLRIVIGLRPAAARTELEQKLSALMSEQTRLAGNAARRPAIRDGIEQDYPVRRRIVRGGQ